jgi:hypothetical protein
VKGRYSRKHRDSISEKEELQKFIYKKKFSVHIYGIHEYIRRQRPFLSTK